MKNFTPFAIVRPDQNEFGGKAYVLSQMFQKGLPVPNGAILSEAPNDSEFDTVFSWWTSIGSPPLAVRSSAVGEDSGEFSYAGQQKTFLNVQSKEELKKAIHDCFESTKAASSRSYREHFDQAANIKMNVLLQAMVDAKYAGVFFSQDPRPQEAGWLIEVVDGLGEKLVSGQATPNRTKSVGDKPFAEWSEDWTEACLQSAIACEEFLGGPVDMEWAVGQDGAFYLLQARPITVDVSSPQKIIDQEIERIKEEHSPETVWDGQTFSEWTSAPTELTFDLWQTAFSKKGAFSKALKTLGYQANDEDFGNPLLERVFGRAYVNLERLAPLFFGEIPYRIHPYPRPHLKFDYTRLNLNVILRTPKPLWQMLSVGWSLRTRRKEKIDLCREQLESFCKNGNWPIEPSIYKGWPEQKLKETLAQEIERFSTETLVYPFVLTFLIESTIQSLQMMLKKIKGEEESQEMLQRWLSVGIHTVTQEMSEAFAKSSNSQEDLDHYIQHFGHRGPGEMDLCQKRWIERDLNRRNQSGESKQSSIDESKVQQDIAEMGRFKGPVIEQEWSLLKEMLELREEWKMQSMRPYAHIRWMALELGELTGLRENIFWLSTDEIKSDLSKEALTSEAKKRQQKVEALRRVSLPMVIDLQTIETWLEEPKENQGNSILGDGISLGVAQGTLVHIKDTENLDIDALPEDLIIVAEATDPGWTPVFRKAKAIVVENGGLLSHCAIVAREMGIPAITGVRHIFKQLPAGRKAWIDGTHGRISIN